MPLDQLTVVYECKCKSFTIGKDTGKLKTNTVHEVQHGNEGVLSKKQLSMHPGKVQHSQAVLWETTSLRMPGWHGIKIALCYLPFRQRLSLLCRSVLFVKHRSSKNWFTSRASSSQVIFPLVYCAYSDGRLPCISDLTLRLFSLFIWLDNGARCSRLCECRSLW